MDRNPSLKFKYFGKIRLKNGKYDKIDMVLFNYHYLM